MLEQSPCKDSAEIERLARRMAADIGRHMERLECERLQTCGVLPFKASPTQRVLNSLLLVSSDILTLLGCYICELRLSNLKIAQTYWAILRLRKFLDDVELIHIHS